MFSVHPYLQGYGTPFESLLHTLDATCAALESSLKHVVLHEKGLAKPLNLDQTQLEASVASHNICPQQTQKHIYAETPPLPQCIKDFFTLTELHT